MDLERLEGKCLRHTTRTGTTGDQPALLCGYPRGHKGPHAWEGMCASAAARLRYLNEMLGACGFVATWEATSGGPGGHSQLVIRPKEHAHVEA